MLKVEATVVNTTIELAKNNRRILINLQQVSSELMKECARFESEVNNQMNKELIRLNAIEYYIRAQSLLQLAEVMVSTTGYEVMEIKVAVEQAAHHRLSLHFISASTISVKSTVLHNAVAPTIYL